MGKVHSIEQLAVSTPSYPGQWLPEGRTNYCNLVKNRDTGFIAEQYIVPADTRIPLMRTFQIYDHRRQQNDYLVEVYQVERQPPSYICQGGDYLRVKTQRIPTRLSDIKYLDENKGLIVLEQALIGYKSIFTFQGPVLINDDMIGFNQNGKVKVWLNNNFAKNTPDGELNPPRYEENTYHASGITNEAGMVSQVVDVVQEHIEPNQFKDFMNLFYATAPRSFVEALQLIKEYSVTRGTSQGRISIPTIQSVNTQPQSQTVIIQNSFAPSITKSLQAPTQPYIIQNFAPDQIIAYQQVPSTYYYVQEPVTEVLVQEPRSVIVGHQPQSVIYQSQPTSIVHPRSTIVGGQRQSVINVQQQQQQQVVVQRPQQIIQRQSIISLEQHQHQHQSQLNTLVQQQPIMQRVEPIHHPVHQVQRVAQHISHPNLIRHLPQVQVIQTSAVHVSPAVASTSQIVSNVRRNDTVHASSQIVAPVSQIVTPTSQIVTATSQINNRTNHRLSYPSPRVNQVRASFSPFQPIQANTNKSLSPFISREQIVKKNTAITPSNNRGPSPTIFRPRPSPAVIRTQGVSPTFATVSKNTSSQIVHPHSQIARVSPVRREQNRKSQVKEAHPTHNIGKELKGIQKTISINDQIDRISPILVTAQRKTQQIRTETVGMVNPNKNITTEKVVQQVQQFIPFSGLPHKRTNIHQIVARPNVPATTTTVQVNKQAVIPQSQVPVSVTQQKVQQQQTQIVQTQTIEQQQQKVSIAAQQAQARLDKLQKDIKNTVIDFSNPFGKQPQNHVSAPTQSPQLPVRPVRPVQPKQQIPVQIQGQPGVFTSFNYQPYRQVPGYPHVHPHPQQTVNVIEERSIFQLGDNISGIRVDPITGASGISTFTNPLLENRAEVNEVVFTEVKSLATYDSVHPEIRKLMMQPRNQQQQQQLQPIITQVMQTTQHEIIDNIPIAQSHQIQTITATQTIVQTSQQQLQQLQPAIVEQIQVIQTYQNITNQQQKYHQVERTERVDVMVTKNDLWTSNDSVNTPQRIVPLRPNPTAQSIGETLVVNQTIREQSEVRQQRGGLDIEFLMRKHNEESKNLFEKYQEYGRNIERQLSPNTPTSPSSLPKQPSPQIRYGGIIVQGQERTNEGRIVYENVQTHQFYQGTNVNAQMYENYYNQQQQIYQQQQQEQLVEEQANRQREYGQQLLLNQQNTLQVEENIRRQEQHYQQTDQQQYWEEYFHQQKLDQEIRARQINQERQHLQRLYQQQIQQQKLQQQQEHNQYQYQQQNNPPVIIHQQITQQYNTNPAYTTTTTTQPHTYQTQHYQQAIYQTSSHSSSTQSRGYQYVATTQQVEYQAPSYGLRNNEHRFLREDLADFGGSAGFKKTTQSFVYGDAVGEVETIQQEIRGSAPTYEELRAALLETNVGFERETETYEEYTTEYRYETTAFEERI